MTTGVVSQGPARRRKGIADADRHTLRVSHSASIGGCCHL